MTVTSLRQQCLAIVGTNFAIQYKVTTQRVISIRLTPWLRSVVNGSSRKPSSTLMPLPTQGNPRRCCSIARGRVEGGEWSRARRSRARFASSARVPRPRVLGWRHKLWGGLVGGLVSLVSRSARLRRKWVVEVIECHGGVGHRWLLVTRIHRQTTRVPAPAQPPLGRVMSRPIEGYGSALRRDEGGRRLRR